MTKQKIIVLVCCMITLSLGGCMDKEKNFTKEEIEESILSYMEEKYGQEFELIDIGKSAPLGNDVEARVISKEDEYKNEINVYWDYEDGRELIVDDYTRLLYKFKVNEMMDPLIDKNFSAFNYISYSSLSDEIQIDKYDKNESFSKLKRKDELSIWTVMLLDENAQERGEEIEKNMLKLYDDVKTDSTNNVHFGIVVLICKNDNYLENVSLINQYKGMYTLDIQSVPLTYNNPSREILKEFYFSSSDLSSGVNVR